MTFLGNRNGVALGVPTHATLNSAPLAYRLAPALSLQFAGSETLDPRITFSRTTNATRTNTLGLIELVAINGPRFDYNPVTLAPKGLLIEEQRTNLLTYSAQFDNAAWSKGNSTITADAIASPDGTVNADKLVEAATTTTHTITVTSTSFTSGTTYTYSIYVKAGERYRGLLTLTTGAVAFGSVVSANFNLQAETITAASGSPTVSIAAEGNGWYRLTITKAAVATASEAGLGIRLADATGATTYTGDGTSGYYIWGAQLEAGAFATSYIPTVAAQVTRTADVATMTGTNFSDWYNQIEGTFDVDMSWVGLKTAAGQVFLQADDGTTSNRIIMGAGATNAMSMNTVSGGLADGAATTPATTYTPNVTYKNALAVTTNSLQAAVNGVSGTVDTTVTMPAVSTLRLGANTTTFNNVWLQRVTYYNRRLTSAELQGITY